MGKKNVAKRVFSFYKVIKINSFTVPTQEKINVVSQEKPQTEPSFVINDKKSNDEYIYYDVHFDIKKNSEGYAPILIDEVYSYKPFDYYFQYNRFNAIQKKDKPYVLFNTSYKKSDPFLNYVGALSKDGFIIRNSLCQNNLLVSKYSINLMKVIEAYHTIGTWFQFDNESNLRSSGTFGPDVNLSDINEYIKGREGKLKSVTIKYIDSGLTYVIIISLNGTIAIMNNTTEKEALNIVESVLELILK